jgi:pimeloyl-ACP methyl ester carboxylesterase
MEAFIPSEQQICREPIVEELLKGKPGDVPQHYSQASAFRMLPLGSPQVLVWGQLDNPNSIKLGEQYVQAAKEAGDDARLVTFPEAGHFEVASPFSKSWPALKSEIVSLLRAPN